MWTAEVAVLAPVPGPYLYEVPAALREGLDVGSRVWVPLRQRNLEGVVLRIAQEHGHRGGLRPIRQRIDCPPLPSDLLALAEFVADYYMVPRGEALRLILPVGTQARSRLRLRLTATGAALAERLQGALLPPEAAALGEEASELLVRLLALGAARRAVAAGRLGAREEDLQRLEAAGFIERSEEVVAGVRASGETLVGVAPGVAQEAEVLGRSPARAALWRRLREEGPLPLRVLCQQLPRAREHIRALAAQGLVTIWSCPTPRDPLAGRWREVTEAAAAPPPASLTPEQERVLAELRGALLQGSGYASFLLHGVTGSGKTEVYLRLIATALDQGRQALVLVPEIGLTPQLAARFRARFGHHVAVLHSALTPGERADAWGRLLRGEVGIALGARSALFAPLGRLGVVIVDEEHDASFKQQEGVRYHARDLALFRARRAGAVAVLGSATPSLEALAMVESGKLRRLSLPDRPGRRPLPEVHIIDLRQHLLRPEDGLLSAPLRRAMEETLAAGEQIILFLNRRGYATFLLCRACGHRFECRYCSVTLTWHKGRGDLLCHYCGYTEQLPERCPVCTAATVERLGMGTERIEEQVAACFPTARVGRLDRDTAAGEGLARVLGAMHRRELDVLIGTQMLAKGHDFPGVTLVGVILADMGMGLPDFRSAERTFQTLSQVAGRAGRADRPGQVLIQTYNPEHPAIRCAARHDYEGFARGELAARRELGYPPASRLAVLRLDGVDGLEVRRAAQAVASRLREVVARAPVEVGASVLGPAEAPLSRLKGKTRWQMLVRAQTVRALRTVLRAAHSEPLPRGVRLSIDIDPVSTL
ncbi:MAG: primosomal protein N' [Myxococcales bacterium]|nr:primosomal protein N' [Myxococcota bacterium]MDW8280122.1 primosomal protein N' [Myxococcales bacterium]